MARTKEEQEYLDLARDLRPMVESAAWPKFVAFINRAQNERHKTLLSPCDNMEQMVRLEREKGAISGMQFAIQAPETILTQAATILEGEGRNQKGTP